MDWKKLFDSIGLNGTHWQWRVIRWQNWWEDRKANLWGKKQAVTYRHKFCPECGAIVEHSDSACAQCGSKVGSWQRQSVSRAFGLAMPTATRVTPVLILVNIGVMLLLMLRYGADNVMFSPPYPMMYGMGALVPAVFYEGEYWRLITYGYLHHGLFHIGFNLFALSLVGSMLEQEIGSARLFAVYTLTLISGGVADLILRPESMADIAGASGALFGLIGFGAAYCHLYGGSLRQDNRNFFLKWGAIGFIVGHYIGADNIAHGGGFVLGLALGVLVERERRNRERWDPIWKLTSTVLLLATLGAYAWMLLEKGGIPEGFVL